VNTTTRRRKRSAKASTRLKQPRQTLKQTRARIALTPTTQQVGLEDLLRQTAATLKPPAARARPVSSTSSRDKFRQRLKEVLLSRAAAWLETLGERIVTVRVSWDSDSLHLNVIDLCWPKPTKRSAKAKRPAKSSLTPTQPKQPLKTDSHSPIVTLPPQGLTLLQCHYPKTP